MNTDILRSTYEKMTEDERFDALFRDHLTGAYNRRAFELSDSAYVAIIDLDSLKWVNDNLGHRAGDTLLVAVAVTLEESFFSRVFRLSGDEFAVRDDNFTRLTTNITSAQTHLETISVGIGSYLQVADTKLRENKKDREEIGLRAPRGKHPPWMKTRKIVKRLGFERIVGNIHLE